MEIIDELTKKLREKGIVIEGEERIYCVANNVGEWVVVTCTADFYEGDEELTSLIDSLLEQAGAPVRGIDIVVIDLGQEMFCYGCTECDLRTVSLKNI